MLGDVRNLAQVQRVFRTRPPDLVFHAAALKHVPLVEANVAEGAATNVIGTANVAETSRANGVRAMVLISTDKAVNPTSVMGTTKPTARRSTSRTRATRGIPASSPCASATYSGPAGRWCRCSNGNSARAGR